MTGADKLTRGKALKREGDTYAIRGGFSSFKSPGVNDRFGKQDKHRFKSLQHPRAMDIPRLFKKMPDSNNSPSVCVVVVTACSSNAVFSQPGLGPDALSSS